MSLIDSMVDFAKSSHNDSCDTVGRLVGFVDDGAKVVGRTDRIIPAANGDDVDGVAVAGWEDGLEIGCVEGCDEGLE